MKCYLCIRLKAEGRIPKVLNAVTILGGTAYCPAHLGSAVVDDLSLRNLELARDHLYKWWDSARAEHGEWSSRKNSFADGFTLSEEYWVS